MEDYAQESPQPACACHVHQTIHNGLTLLEQWKCPMWHPWYLQLGFWPLCPLLPPKIFVPFAFLHFDFVCLEIRFVILQFVFWWWIVVVVDRKSCWHYIFCWSDIHWYDRQDSHPTWGRVKYHKWCQSWGMCKQQGITMHETPTWLEQFTFLVFLQMLVPNSNASPSCGIKSRSFVCGLRNVRCPNCIDSFKVDIAWICFAHFE